MTNDLFQDQDVSEDPEYLEFKEKRKPSKFNAQIVALNVGKEQNHASVVNVLKLPTRSQ